MSTPTKFCQLCEDNISEKTRPVQIVIYGGALGGQSLQELDFTGLPKIAHLFLTQHGRLELCAYCFAECVKLWAQLALDEPIPAPTTVTRVIQRTERVQITRYVADPDRPGETIPMPDFEERELAPETVTEPAEAWDSKQRILPAPERRDEMRAAAARRRLGREAERTQRIEGELAEHRRRREAPDDVPPEARDAPVSA